MFLPRGHSRHPVRRPAIFLSPVKRGVSLLDLELCQMPPVVFTGPGNINPRCVCPAGRSPLISKSVRHFAITEGPSYHEPIGHDVSRQRLEAKAPYRSDYRPLSLRRRTARQAALLPHPCFMEDAEPGLSAKVQTCLRHRQTPDLQVP